MKLTILLSLLPFFVAGNYYELSATLTPPTGLEKTIMYKVQLKVKKQLDLSVLGTNYEIYISAKGVRIFNESDALPLLVNNTGSMFKINGAEQSDINCFGGSQNYNYAEEGKAANYIWKSDLICDYTFVSLTIGTTFNWEIPISEVHEESKALIAHITANIIHKDGKKTAVAAFTAIPLHEKSTFTVNTGSISGGLNFDYPIPKISSNLEMTFPQGLSISSATVRGLDAGVAISKAGQTITLLKPFGTNLNNSNIISFTVDGLTGEATTTSFATISAYKQDSKLGKRIIESWYPTVKKYVEPIEEKEEEKDGGGDNEVKDSDSSKALLPHLLVSLLILAVVHV